MKRLIVPLLSGMLGGCMLYFPQDTAQAAIEACRLWALAVMPSLFPFLVCMLFVAGRITIGQKQGGGRLLGMPSGFGLLLCMGLMSGSPGGARLTQEFSIKDEAGRAALKRFVLYSGTMSPMFFVGTLGGWLYNHQLGWILLLAHWLGAFMTGQLSRLIFAVPKSPSPQTETLKKPINVSQVMQSAAFAMLTVCGLMMLGSVAARMVGCALPFLPEGALAALQAFLEVTAGCSRIVGLTLPDAYPALRPALLCTAASFGGMSILLQNLAFLQEAGIGLFFLVKGALCHALLSFGLYYLLHFGVPGASVPTSVQVPQTASEASFIVISTWLLSLIIPYVTRSKKLFS